MYSYQRRETRSFVPSSRSSITITIEYLLVHDSSAETSSCHESWKIEHPRRNEPAHTDVSDDCNRHSITFKRGDTEYPLARTRITTLEPRTKQQILESIQSRILLRRICWKLRTEHRICRENSLAGYVGIYEPNTACSVNLLDVQSPARPPSIRWIFCFDDSSLASCWLWEIPTRVHGDFQRWVEREILMKRHFVVRSQIIDISKFLA